MRPESWDSVTFHLFTPSVQIVIIISFKHDPPPPPPVLCKRAAAEEDDVTVSKIMMCVRTNLQIQAGAVQRSCRLGALQTPPQHQQRRLAESLWARVMRDGGRGGQTCKEENEKNIS